MSHVARLSLFAVLVACSSPKPPAGEEAAVPSADPALQPASEPAPEAPPAPDVPAATETPPTAAPSSPTASASSDAPVVETLFVRDTLADCQAEGVRQCLQVRSTEQEDWRNFFGSIEGFQREPSYAYELRVAVSPVPNAPLDAPALRYRLLEVVAKRKAGK
jgi:hypothetical protein